MIAEEVYQTNSKQTGKKSSVKSWLYYILSLVMIVIVFRFILGITVIVGNSMNPTLENNDIILSSNMFFTPKRDDIIVYRDIKGFDVIKRIIGMPNDTVEIKAGVVYVNGLPMEEIYITGMANDMAQIVVQEDAYFVMGDNREPGASLDSRDPGVGPIYAEQIKGKALLSIYPFGFLK